MKAVYANRSSWSPHVEIVTLENKAQWIEEHRIDGLPSQSWHNAWAMSAMGIEPKLAVVRAERSRMLLPFYERFEDGYGDIATIQGLSGASIVPTSVEPLKQWEEYARSRWVAGYIQFAAGEMSAGIHALGKVLCKDVYILDLRDGDLLGPRVSRNVRRKIKRAEQDRVRLVDDPERVAEALANLHPLTAQRVGAERHHQFTAETLKRWALDPTCIALGAQLNGAIEAACTFVVAGHLAEYHIMGSSERGRDFAGWLIWQATQRLRSRGVTSVNLGAGVRPNDGLCSFKERLGGIRSPQYAICQIYDSTVYERLCSARPNLSGDWFPAYRSR